MIETHSYYSTNFDHFYFAQKNVVRQRSNVETAHAYHWLGVVIQNSTVRMALMRKIAKKADRAVVNSLNAGKRAYLFYSAYIILMDIYWEFPKFCKSKNKNGGYLLLNTGDDAYLRNGCATWIMIAVHWIRLTKMNRCARWKRNVCQIKANVRIPMAKAPFVLIPNNFAMAISTVSTTNILNTVVSVNSMKLIKVWMFWFILLVLLLWFDSKTKQNQNPIGNHQIIAH